MQDKGFGCHDVLSAALGVAPRSRAGCRAALLVVGTLVRTAFARTARYQSGRRSSLFKSPSDTVKYLIRFSLSNGGHRRGVAQLGFPSIVPGLGRESAGRHAERL